MKSWRVYIQCDALALDDALAVLLINIGLALVKPVLGVQLARDAEEDAERPAPVGVGLRALGALPLPDGGGVEDRGGVEAEVPRVS